MKVDRAAGPLALEEFATERIPHPTAPAVSPGGQPHVVLVAPRGEAVRNFLYSDTLRVLSEGAQVSLLSVVDDERLLADFLPLLQQAIPLRNYRERRVVAYLRRLIELAHYRWMWSEVAQNLWEWRDAEATTAAARLRRMALKAAIRPFSNRPCLELLTRLERAASWRLRPTDEFLQLFQAIRPNVVFNGSHIHGPAAEQPLRAAHRLRIPSVGFIFSWDNLTSRSRILTPYDYYMVWTERMREELLETYPSIRPDRVFVTGSPQFDFHFKPEFRLDRADLCRRIGADPARPIILYTAGIDNHFPEEHRHVEFVARLLGEIAAGPRPQLVVRTYVKGTSPEMKALAARGLPDVLFPPVQWEEKWFTPAYEDLAIYTSLLRHCAVGVNGASTVSLELMMHDKPVMNLGFDPPGSSLPHHFRWARHIEFDHYRPVAQSGAVMVARSTSDVKTMLRAALTNDRADSEKRQQFLNRMFGNTLDGNAGRRVAEQLLALAREGQPRC